MHLASPFGIPVHLHWTFFLLVGGLVSWGGYLGGATGMLLLAAMSAGLAASVILHELGHALAALNYGIKTAHITLYPMGGVAAIESMPEEPDQEIVIALAGPAVNVVLAGLGSTVWAVWDHPVVTAFVLTNLGMCLFNLLPAFPMDGGRVLRAVLARFLGFVPASRLAVRVGRVFAAAFIVGGLWWLHPGLVLTGSFLFFALRSEEERLVQRVWEDATGRPPPWVSEPGDRARPLGSPV